MLRFKQFLNIRISWDSFLEACMIRRKFQFLFLFMFFLSTFAFAQKNTGTIEGNLYGSEGQTVPGATVTASSSSLIGGSTTIYSNEDGYYRFPALAPGTYEVKAELQGFQTVIRRNVDLSVGLTLALDFTLQISNVTEIVEV